MRTRYLIVIAFCAVWLCGTPSAVADELPVYPGAALIAQDTSGETTTGAYSLLGDAKQADIWAFYQQSLKLSDGWKQSTSIDSPRLFLRTLVKDGRTFGVALYGDRMLLVDSTDASETAVADWVREAVNTASPPVATVDSEGIPWQVYYSRVEHLPYQDNSTGQSTEAGLLVMQRLVTERLLLKMAQDQGVAPTEEQIANRVATAMKQPGLAQNMRRSGIGEAQFKEMMRIEQAAFNLQTKGMTATTDEISKFYDAHVANFTSPKMVHLAGIFVDSKKDADKAMALLKSNVEFGTVARTMSKHQSSKYDGKLAPISRGAAGIPESVQKTIFSTPVGKYTRPIASGGGAYAIFSPLQYVPSKVQKLDEVADAIRDRVMLEKGMKQNPSINTELTKMRDSSDIKVSIKRYAGQIAQPPAEPTGPAVIRGIP